MIAGGFPYAVKISSLSTQTSQLVGLAVTAKEVMQSYGSSFSPMTPSLRNFRFHVFKVEILPLCGEGFWRPLCKRQVSPSRSGVPDLISTHHCTDIVDISLRHARLDVGSRCFRFHRRTKIRLRLELLEGNEMPDTQPKRPKSIPHLSSYRESQPCDSEDFVSMLP
jgi:hypothetical protein